MTVFEDLERAANAAVMTSLSNREAVIDGAVRARGVFDANPAVAFGAVETAAPSFVVSLSEWPQPARGDEFAICGDVYRVISVELDGLGFARLSLERQS